VGTNEQDRQEGSVTRVWGADRRKENQGRPKLEPGGENQQTRGGNVKTGKFARKETHGLGIDKDMEKKVEHCGKKRDRKKQ